MNMPKAQPRGRARRPLLRYHGGKFMIAPWVVGFFPQHVTYVEAFGGGASVLLHKPLSTAELYNDLDETIVNIFRVLRDPELAPQLVRALSLTPYSRKEFKAAYEISEDPVERARRTIVRSFMGFGGDGTNGRYPTGFRATVTSSKKMPANEWAHYPKALLTIIERVSMVVLECRDAFELIPRMDSPETLHYVDPPYLPSTRSRGNRRRGQGFHVYAHELEEEDHARLLAMLQDVEGMVVLSGYPSALYDDTLIGWERHTREARADGGRPRTECVWLNPAVQKRLEIEARVDHGPLYRDRAGAAHG